LFACKQFGSEDSQNALQAPARAFI
jgi:hypothetical protein